MKPASHPFHERSVFGYHYEKVLKPAIEKILGESILKTTTETDTMDFFSKNCFAELKTRGDQYHYSQWFIKKDGWLLPTCKIRRAIEETQQGKKVVFFYYWTAGKSLWKWDFCLDDLKDTLDEVPAWHHDRQRQSYVLEHHWVRVL